MKEVKRTKQVPSRNDARTANGARHRKRRKRSYTLYYLLLLFFVLISGITLSVTVFFNVDTITVTGIERYTAEQIIAQSGMKVGNNLFRINTGKGEEKLLQGFKDIDAVTVERKFPNELKIEVTESVPTYFFENGDRTILLSAGGRVLRTDATAEEIKSIIRLVGFVEEEFAVGDFLDSQKDEKYGILDKLMTVLAENELGDITQVDLTSEVDLSVLYQDRVKIRLGSMSELSYKVKFAKHVLDNELESTEEGLVDVSTAGKVYYTPSEIHSRPVSSETAASGTAAAPESGSTDASDPSSGTGGASSADTASASSSRR